jgi:transcription initiation factor IIE alpha subunit
MVLTFTCPCCEDDITLATQPDDESYITCPECSSLLSYDAESNSLLVIEDCYTYDADEDDEEFDNEDVD